MDLFVGLALGGLGVLLIVAGIRNRGAELASTLTGGSTLGTKVGGAAYLPSPAAGPTLPGTVAA